MDFIQDTPEHLRCTEDTSNPTLEAVDSQLYKSYSLDIDSMTGSCSFQSEQVPPESFAENSDIS